MDPVEIVTRQSDLDAHCKSWRRLGRFAFDTEFIRDETYESALCLIQVAANGEVVLIDPTAPVDLSSFWDLVTSEKVITVVHAGKEDFLVLTKDLKWAGHGGLSFKRGGIIRQLDLTNPGKQD